MQLEEMLVKVYESLDDNIINEAEADILIDGIYERAIDSFLLECELEYMDEWLESPILESTNDEIEDGDYTYAKLQIYEAVEAGEIREEFADFMLEVIEEAEKDHRVHMRQKKVAAERLGVKPNDLVNKKYATDKNGNLKDPEKARKADLKYKYKDMTLKKRGKNGVEMNGATWNVNNMLIDTKDSKSTIKMLEYLKKKGKEGDEESIKKYQQVFKMFCRKYGLNENSGLYIVYNPRKVFKGYLGVSEWKEGQGRDSKVNYGEEKGHALPSGYSLIHMSPVDGIKELRPTRMTNHHLGAGKSGVNGQYRLTGRVYLTLRKAGEELKDNHASYHSTLGRLNGKLGNHIYKVTDHISEFFVDAENPKSRGLDKVSLDDLIGKAVYVKTEKPIKVQQLR